MNDIVIHTRKNTCTVAAESDKGKLWMYGNYKSFVTTIPIDVLEDFKKDLKELKLTYEDL